MSVKGSLSRGLVGSESKVLGFDNKVFDVSSDSPSLGLVFSSSVDLSGIKGSSDLSTFLSQLLPNVA